MRLLGEQFVHRPAPSRRRSPTRARARRAATAIPTTCWARRRCTADDAAALLRRLRAGDRTPSARAASGRGIDAGPGISVKLSALHPRYSRAAARARDRTSCCRACRRWPLLAKPARHRLQHRRRGGRPPGAVARPARTRWLPIRRSAGWRRARLRGAGLPEARAVGDRLADRRWRARSGRRLMVRLVKGAYWDSEIKRAQVDGLAGYPVFTRKAHTDVSYLACAKHAARPPRCASIRSSPPTTRTPLAAIYTCGQAPASTDYEFQCLHGMGEALYDQVRRRRQARPRLPHLRAGRRARDLLAYLVRRLLENGANTSFVNRSSTTRCRSRRWSPIRSARSRQPRRRARIRRSRCRGDLYGPSATIRAASTSATTPRCAALEAELAALRPAAAGTPRR